MKEKLFKVECVDVCVCVLGALECVLEIISLSRS